MGDNPASTCLQERCINVVCFEPFHPVSLRREADVVARSAIGFDGASWLGDPVGDQLFCAATIMGRHPRFCRVNTDLRRPV